MDWQEVNCVIDALKLLVEQHAATIRNSKIDEDTRADATNDLAYTEIILSKYEEIRRRASAT